VIHTGIIAFKESMRLIDRGAVLTRSDGLLATVVQDRFLKWSLHDPASRHAVAD
jgi:hypothetical protein